MPLVHATSSFLVLSSVGVSSEPGLWLVPSPSADRHVPGADLTLVTGKGRAPVVLPVLFPLPVPGGRPPPGN